MRRMSFAMVATLLSGPVAAQAIDPAAIAAITAASADWDAAYTLAADADPVAADVLTWLRLRDGDATFDDYRLFVGAHPDWPGQARLRARAEPLIPKDYDPEAIIAWFHDDPPQTGEGATRYAEALLKTGQIEQANAYLREAWLTLGLTDAGHNALIQSFPDVLAPYHTARADAMLWRSRRGDANRMLPLLETDQRALAAARIGYIAGTRNMLPLYEAVPVALREDPGFAYDRYSWRAQRGDWTDAVTMLRERSTSRAALGEPFRWAGWRRVLARWEMREGRAEQAYILASRHYLDEGAFFADLEWLSGYIALTYLGNPERALAHFEKASAAVSSPISISRMQYWAGRAHEVMENADQAALAYGAAAAHQTAFYGLLAAEKLGRPLDPTLVGQSVEWDGALVFERELTKAAFMLLAGGERGAAVTFFAELGKTLSPVELAQVGAYLDHLNEQYYTLLLGKTAVTRGLIIPSLYFPIHDLAEMELPVSPALALSIARRESEFNTTIGSPVGALGLMQLMPGTAEEVAGQLNLPYSRGRLTNDWRYNATLGAQYLAGLEETFGPTPVMIAAGYNAGPGRPRDWMEERGDPRLREMDVIDWIEHIPFRETRNYVMRVTESLPIYEARLSGRTGQVGFTALLIGEKPLLRPRTRPVPQDDQLRPVARPVTD
ncbi:lytic transglycosylase domain-containing protein [Loktanella sp. S4079]|uniref:lytic transglycosylase domain-containing protein n=1 Tax=Loktanella sp. S4079 TaxID=579483 RepID=UPI000AE1CA40|nr:lytic transglycosylase domain-containing protein [Loktanella sp. S4079]